MHCTAALLGMYRACTAHKCTAPALPTRASPSPSFWCPTLISSPGCAISLRLFRAAAAASAGALGGGVAVVGALPVSARRRRCWPLQWGGEHYTQTVEAPSDARWMASIGQVTQEDTVVSVNVQGSKRCHCSQYRRPADQSVSKRNKPAAGAAGLPSSDGSAASEWCCTGTVHMCVVCLCNCAALRGAAGQAAGRLCRLLRSSCRRLQRNAAVPCCLLRAAAAVPCCRMLGSVEAPGPGLCRRRGRPPYALLQQHACA